MTAFIDTMVLVWWVRQEAPDGQHEMLKRAQWLMTKFEDEKVHVMVSAITVAEFLRGADQKQRARQRAVIEETFICRPFDAHAAEVAGDLLEKALSVDDYQAHKGILKGDLQIIATAIASNADVLYSHDRRMRNLATKCGLIARDLPNVAPTLFD